MKTLKLFLALTLLAFLSSSFTLKVAKHSPEPSLSTTDYYLGTFDFITDDDLVLPVDIFGYNDTSGGMVVTYGENAINHTHYDITGTVVWMGSVKWADLAMTYPTSLNRSGALYW